MATITSSAANNTHVPATNSPAARQRSTQPRPPFASVADVGLSPARVAAGVEALQGSARSRAETLWIYYRNPMRSTAMGPRSYRLGQERGLPARLVRPPAGDDRAEPRELVIENDIAWRIGAMVDFLVGKPVRLVSRAPDQATRALVETALARVWERSGGLAALQRAALLGHIFGHVDMVVRRRQHEAETAAIADLYVDIIDPRCGRPVTAGPLSALTAPPAPAGALADPASGTAYVIHTAVPGPRAAADDLQSLTEVITPTHRQLYADRGSGPVLIHQERNAVSPGQLPVARAVNSVGPEGEPAPGEVEPLIPMQDELNTRLSDRAYRVTLQSFKMLLAKGLAGFDKAPVGPGMVWATDNPDAAIETFGGDAASPSEDRHIDELREALDKLSGVPPLATGVVRAKVGNLSSENALRLTLQGLLARTRRKRVTYGSALLHASGLILAALHESGELPTDTQARALDLQWPDELVGDGLDALREAQAKRELGVPAKAVLTELGYPQ